MLGIGKTQAQTPAGTTFAGISAPKVSNTNQNKSPMLGGYQEVDVSEADKIVKYLEKNLDAAKGLKLVRY